MTSALAYAAGECAESSLSVRLVGTQTICGLRGMSVFLGARKAQASTGVRGERALRALGLMSNGRPDRTTNRRYARRGLQLARLGDIEIVADFSLLFIIALITINLGAGLLPVWHPEWSSAVRWAVALGSALLFIMSITAHELAHAIVARAFGLPVHRIVLFLFGGMAQLKREPANARSEFWMAAVGPVVSLLIGMLCIVAGAKLTPAIEQLETDPLSVMSHASPLATILLWLGPLNVMLGLFNLVPGFPLDGGRVLRAALWWLTGDLRKATLVASRIGQGFAWLLMTWGILMILGQNMPFFGRGFGPGLWLLLIGWFLNHAARSSYQLLLLRQSLSELSLRDIMDVHVSSVPPEISVLDLIRERTWKRDQLLPVARDGVLLGMLEPDQLRTVPHDRRADVRIAEVMTPVSKLTVMTPETAATELIEAMKGQDTIPVVDHTRLVGVARREDLRRWLAWSSVSA
jgi:Zn-dependent protease/predicted transcriptional regulator